MNNNSEYLEISLAPVEEGLKLIVSPELKSQLFEIDEEEAIKYGESRYQLLEGNSYEYELNSKDYRLQSSVSGIVTISSRHRNSGRIIPNTYVGTLTLFISKENVVIE